MGKEANWCERIIRGRRSVAEWRESERDELADKGKNEEEKKKRIKSKKVVCLWGRTHCTVQSSSTVLVHSFNCVSVNSACFYFLV